MKLRIVRRASGLYTCQQRIFWFFWILDNWFNEVPYMTDIEEWKSPEKDKRIYWLEKEYPLSLAHIVYARLIKDEDERIERNKKPSKIVETIKL